MYEELATQIISNLHLGSINDIRNKFPENNNIDLILNVAVECNYNSDIEQKHFKFIDSSMQNLEIHFDPIVDIICDNINNNKSVLIHCSAGKSRSASIVLAYLIKKQNMTLQNALNYVQEKRDIYPNLNFIQQLMNYEKRINDLNESTLNYDDYIISYTSSMFPFDNKIVSDTYVESNKNIDLMMEKLFSLSNNL